MAKIITLISNETKSGKTTIAFNLSILLSRKNKKILLINQEYTSSYLTLIPKAIKSETKNIIAPFSLLKYDRYLSILLFANVKNIIHKYNYAKLFPKQLQLLINQFDYIIIDASYVWNKLGNIALACSTEVVAIYDSDNFTSQQLQKTMMRIRQNQSVNPNLKLTTFILNNFQNNKHMNSLLEVTKTIGTKYLFIILPNRKELQSIDRESVKFVKYNQWDDYTIELQKIVNGILKNG